MQLCGSESAASIFRMKSANNKRLRRNTFTLLNFYSHEAKQTMVKCRLKRGSEGASAIFKLNTKPPANLCLTFAVPTATRVFFFVVVVVVVVGLLSVACKCKMIDVATLGFCCCCRWLSSRLRENNNEKFSLCKMLAFWSASNCSCNSFSCCCRWCCCCSFSNCCSCYFCWSSCSAFWQCNVAM